MRPLNLLNYPSLARQRKVFHHWWTGLAGLLVGSAVAWGWQQWQALDTERLQQAQSPLQAAWAARMQRAKEISSQQARWRLQAEQVVHLQQIAKHQKAWMALHTALQQEAEDRGLRLQGLQAEADKIELQGQMARFEAMSDARQSLSDQLGHSFDLTSSTVGPGEALGFVWQASWPAAQGGLVAPPARTPKSTP